MQNCNLTGEFRVPYNSREQFVKLAVFAVGHGGPDALVGEACVPTADPASEELREWRLVRDFEEIKLIIMQTFSSRFSGQASRYGGLGGLEKAFKTP